jgi:hypothetical protein
MTWEPTNLPARGSAHVSRRARPPLPFQHLSESALPLLPFPLLHGRRTSGPGEIHLSLPGPYSAQKATPRLVRKIPVATASSYPLGPLATSSRRPSRPWACPSAMMPTKCLALQVPGDLFTRRPWMPYYRYLPSSLVNESIPSPYVPTMAGKCCASTLTGWLTHTSSSADLHHG